MPVWKNALGSRPAGAAAPAVAGRGEQVEWLNAARGLAILLVIFHHTVWFAYLTDLADPRWMLVDAVFNAFRMPMFFAVSGVLTAAVLTRPWRAVLGRRVVPLVWVYVVWTVAVELLEPALPPGGGPVPGVVQIASRVLLGDSDAWYLYALVVFAVVAKLTARVPTWVVLGVLTASAVVFGSDLVVPDSYALHSMAMYALFFFAGTRFRGRVLALPRSGVRWWGAAAGAVGFAAIAGAAYLVLGSQALSVPGVKLVLSFAALAAGYLFSVWVVGVAVGVPLTAVGRLTLSFYVTHTLVARLLLLAALAVLPGAAASSALGQLVVPVLLVVATIGAVAVVRVPLDRVPGLFAPPRWLVRRIAPAARPGTPAAGVPEQRRQRLP
ncbi:acyltransferase family protein [Kineococcus sp. SYSU DK001]|uniref:acyltransferase family protein n=1 Tax=Kineococcus sp. SYSU DK001 TaxID=3383122 RepID=UPI003D7CC79A